MKRFLDYNFKLKERASELRKNMTEPEKKLWFWFLGNIKIPPTPLTKGGVWQDGGISLAKGGLTKTSPLLRGTERDLASHLLRGTKGDLRVYRQRMIDNFIVDFYIPKLKLVIEIDGESHFTEEWLVYDKERTSVLEWLWLKIMRFTNEEVMKNFDEVCGTLDKEFGI